MESDRRRITKEERLEKELLGLIREGTPEDQQ